MKLEISDKQARILINALDAYSRISIGQTEALGDMLTQLFKPENLKDNSYWDIREKYTDKIKQELFGFSPGASYGIGNKKVSDAGHIAYDLLCVIRKDIADRETHHISSVWHGEPLHYGSEPLAKIL